MWGNAGGAEGVGAAAALRAAGWHRGRLGNGAAVGYFWESRARACAGTGAAAPLSSLPVGKEPAGPQAGQQGPAPEIIRVVSLGRWGACGALDLIQSRAAGRSQTVVFLPLSVRKCG